MKVTINEDKFREYLNQYPLEESTKDRYVMAVKEAIKFIHNFEDQEKSLNYMFNKFLKEKPREYNRVALNKYYSDYKDLDLDLIRPDEPTKEPKEVPEIEDLKKLIEKIDKEGIIHKDTYYIYLIALATGSRISEILNLEMKDIDFEEGYINFTTKGGGKRRISLSKERVKELEDYLKREKGCLATDKCFFETSKNERVAYKLLRRNVNRLVERGILEEKEANILKNTHNFRRVVINYIHEKTGDLLATAEYVDNTIEVVRDNYISEKRAREAREKAAEVMKEEI